MDRQALVSTPPRRWWCRDRHLAEAECNRSFWKSPWAWGFVPRSVHWLKAASEAGFAMAQKNLALAEGLRPQEDAMRFLGSQFKLPSWHILALASGLFLEVVTQVDECIYRASLVKPAESE